MSSEKPIIEDQNVITMEPQVRPPDYTGQVKVMPEDPDMNTIYLSIFTMLFCCWPCGLVGLIYGIQGMQQHYRGQLESAERTTKTAKKWTICGIVSGVTYVCIIIFLVIVAYAVGFGVGFGRRA